MTAREKRLQRLLNVRRIREEAERGHLQRVLASVAEVQSAIDLQCETIASAAEASGLALQDADRREWLFCEAQSEVADWNRARLMPILEMRRSEVDPATAAFLDRRREHEQIRELIKRSRLQRQSAEDRRAQAAADDRFLAQRASRRK